MSLVSSGMTRAKRKPRRFRDGVLYLPGIEHLDVASVPIFYISFPPGPQGAAPGVAGRRTRTGAGDVDRTVNSHGMNNTRLSPPATQVPQNVLSTRSPGAGGCSNSPQPG